MISNKTENTLDFHGRLEVAVQSMLAPVNGGRSENQDNFLVVDATGRARYMDNQKETEVQIENWVDGHCRLAILDGMGGHSFGREATEMTIAGILEMPPSNNLGVISDYLDALHARLHLSMQSEGPQPGCTLTLVEVPPIGEALLFHAGDSRLYQIDDEQADYLTIDHVPATKFALFGLLDSEEWYRQAHRNSGFQISQAFILGSSLSTRDLFGESLDAKLYELKDSNLPAFLRGLGDRRSLQLRGGFTYLLASDGLWHLGEPLPFIDRWPALIGPGPGTPPLAEQLNALFDALITETAKEPRLRGDNTTAIAFRVTG